MKKKIFLPESPPTSPPTTDPSMTRVLMEKQTKNFLADHVIPRLPSLEASADVCYFLSSFYLRTSRDVVPDNVLLDAVTKFILVKGLNEKLDLDDGKSKDDGGKGTKTLRRFGDKTRDVVKECLISKDIDSVGFVGKYLREQVLAKWRG